MSQPKPRRKKSNNKPSVISKKNNVKPTVAPSSTSIFGAKRGLKAFESKIVPDTGKYDGIQSFNPHGHRITLEDAIELKNICWGSPDVVPHPSWLSGLKFNDPEEPTAFGLSVEEGAPKAFLMTLQGILLRFLLYKECKSALKVQKRSKGRSYMSQDFMQPNSTRQRELTANAIIDLLWKLGDKKYAVFAIQGPTHNFDPQLDYERDKITEKLHVFRCKSRGELKVAVKRNFRRIMMDKKGGIQCLLYSIIYSKGISEIKKEMQHLSNKPLIDRNGKMSFCLCTLMLTGKATPYLHNGTREGKDGNLKIGVPDKKDLDVGLLVSYSDSGTMRLFNTPSTTKLKNPTLPIWVICSDDKWGVLFSPNADLLKQYTKEFNMHYYSGSKDPNHFKKETMVQIDAREAIFGTNLNNYYPEIKTNNPDAHLVELAVQTKWEKAKISWINCDPYI